MRKTKKEGKSEQSRLSPGPVGQETAATSKPGDLRIEEQKPREEVMKLYKQLAK
jgi:hypothetical protein